MEGTVHQELENCPICGNRRRESFSDTLHRCRSCRIIFNSGHKSLAYDNDYFVDEYKNQYGRTYQEDFPHIYNLACLRLDRIFRFGRLKDPSALSLLDIGSALGFFLKAAHDRGMRELKGIEISEYGASYTAEEFSIPVTRAPFEESKVGGSYNLITAWFFIEHSAAPRQVLERIFDSLESGGVFAMAVPSFYGPLFRRHRDEWISTHPKDHRIDFSPGTARKILKDIGFRKIMVRPCGMHPERVMKSTSLFYPLFTRAYRLFSRITAYSDTIEVYALK